LLFFHRECDIEVPSKPEAGRTDRGGGESREKEEKGGKICREDRDWEKPGNGIASCGNAGAQCSDLGEEAG